MKIIGITGGVGSGKSTVLHFLEDRYRCRLLLADEIANRLKEPDGVCFRPVIELLGEEIVGCDGRIDNKKMAERLFSDGELLQRINSVIHPEVKRYILEETEAERRRGTTDYIFLEAAIFVEAGLKSMVDELWYIYSEPEVRIKRLMDSRGYSEEKCRAVMAKQMSDEDYFLHADAVINNSSDFIFTEKQIIDKMGE